MTEPKKYSYNLNKLHENILLKKSKKSNNLDKIELLQIYVKQRRPIKYNIVSSRDATTLYYVYIRASGFRLSPSLNYKFEFFAAHSHAIRKMRKVTKKLQNKRDFTFVLDPSYIRIKAFDTITTGLENDGQYARSHAPSPDRLAAAVLNTLTPGELSEVEKQQTRDHMNIL